MNKPIAMSDAGSFELPASDQLTFQTVMATSLDEAITCMVEHAELEIKPDHYYYIALDMGESMIYILRVRPKVTWFTTAFNCGIYKAIPKGGRKGF
jgi:hypothetical protein